MGERLLTDPATNPVEGFYGVFAAIDMVWVLRSCYALVEALYCGVDLCP
jgi:hypothetical protein